MSQSVQSLLQAFAWPGMRLMRVLSFPAKTALMSVVLLAPLCWLTAQSVMSAKRELESIRLEAAGSPLVTQTLSVVAQTQKHRGLMNRTFAGDATAERPLLACRAELKTAIDALQSTVAEQQQLKLSEAWKPIRQTLERFAAGDVPRDAAQSFLLHSEQVEALRAFLARSAEASGLLLDSNPAGFHLMHLAVEPLVPWTEALGQLRGRGAALLRKGEAAPADQAEMVAQIRLLSQATASADIMLAALARSGEAVPDSAADAIARSHAFAQRSAALFAGSTPAGDAAAYFDEGTAAIGLAVDVGVKATQRLQTLLEQRAQLLRKQWLIAIAVGLATVLGVAYLSMAYFRTSFGAVRVLQGAVAQLAAGDFSSRVRLRGTDELSVVASSLDGMAGRISEMVADIRSNSTMVAQAGLDLSEATKALSQRTESQASSLEQTAASVNELSTAVRNSAHGAEAASTRAANVRRIAEDGGSAIQSAVASMQDIQSSSRRVQEIVGVIESLSFQTNILALNAAVEAARAGDQGRGFAVVAAEVRSLAHRSAASAREIKALIDASAENVATGAKQITAGSQTFAEIVQGIREVASSVHDIKSSAVEQSNGLDQISQAIRHIDQLTQQNAEMVESAFHSSSQLSERADRLAGAVGSFKLRQGSADEALAFVHRAADLYRAQGQAALRRITEEACDYTDKDMYVFAFDRNGVYRAFAGNAGKVGSAVRDNPGVDGDKLVRDAFDQAGRGGGWVDYDFTNPQSGAVDLKTSYVEAVSSDLVLGCGIYKQRAAQVDARPLDLPLDSIRLEQRSRLVQLGTT